jgi:predicted permease
MLAQRFWLKLQTLFRRKRAAQQLADELQFHLDEQIAENIAAGMSPEEARHSAMRTFGNATILKEETRETWGWRWLEDLFGDLRFGVRMLRKNPGLTAAAVLTLALGIGANTAMFSLINALMLRTLPVRDPGQLVELLHRFPGEPALSGFSNEAFQILRDQNHVFSGLIAATHQPFNVRGDSLESHTIAGGYVDGNFFAVLGLQPATGRLIGAQDDAIPSSVAVVSWSYWKDKFNSDPGIVGKQILVNDVAMTVVGVAPQGFSGLSHEASQDLWFPLSMQPVISRTVLGWGALSLVGRLKPGVSFEQAQAQMVVLFHSAMQAPNNNPFLRQMKFEMASAAAGLSSPLRQQFAKPLLVLMAVVSLLLFIACANVASLLLVRGAARLHEMGVRICLGAGRLRLVRQVLTESLLLSAIGSLLGIAVAYYGANGLVRIIDSGRPMPGSPINFVFQVKPDLHVMFFTAGVALLTGLLFGIAAAIRAVATVPLTALRQSGQGGKSVFGRLFGKSLVVTQVALSVVLLSVSASFTGYLSNLEHLDLGFRRDHLLLVSLDARHSGLKPEQFLQQAKILLEQLEAVPGVQSATLSAMTPISGSGQSCYCADVEGHEEAIGDHHILTSFNRVAPNYFETYGTPLLAGRAFSPQDPDARAVIINEAMARDYFGDGSPLGKHLSFDGFHKSYEIVGVVGDARYNEIREDTRRMIYLDVFQDAFQEGHVSSQLTLRTTLDLESIAPEARRIVNNLLKTVPVARITTMTDQVDASIVPERLIATLSGWFSALGALLAAIGLYGLLSYTMARRTNEIGVRMALGATRGNVTRMVLGDALWSVAGGVAIGVPVAFWGKKIAVSLIRDLPVNNSVAIVLSVLAMLTVALFAAYLPARRAAHIDPMNALRHE